MAEVSIIIPVYNVAPYICRCLDSVVSQSFQDIECILIDDCSIDNSMAIVENFIHNYHGNICFKILHHTHNQGLSAARNTGIKHSTSTYLYFLDSDDTITHDCIESFVALSNKYPNIDFVQGNILNENGQISHYGIHLNIPEFINKEDELSCYILSKVISNACNRLIRKEFLIKHNLFFPEGIVHEDMYWVYFLAKYTQSAAFSSKGTYIYYINKDSIMTSISKEKRIARYTSRLKAAWDFINDMKQYPSNKYQRQYLANNLLSCLSELSGLNSFWHWLEFWINILKIVIQNLNRVTKYRIIFLFVLFPPICFFTGKKKIRWHIQETIVPKL